MIRVVNGLPVQVNNHRVSTDNGISIGIEDTGRQAVFTTIHITHGGADRAAGLTVGFAVQVKLDAMIALAAQCRCQFQFGVNNSLVIPHG